MSDKLKLFKKLSFEDKFRKLLSYFFNKICSINFNKFRSWYFFKNSKINIGKNIQIKGQSYHICIKKKASIYDNCIFEFGQNSSFNLGVNSLISYNVLIACQTKIFIGDNTQIGEFTSIRDSTHDYVEKGVPIKFNDDLLGEISIGNNVWIGRGCLILPNTTIEDGVIIGANSIVKGHYEMDSIYAGCPAKFIKKR